MRFLAGQANSASISWAGHAEIPRILREEDFVIVTTLVAKLIRNLQVQTPNRNEKLEILSHTWMR